MAASNPSMNITEVLGRQDRKLQAAVGIFLLLAATVSHVMSPPGLETAFFYLVPVSFLTWYFGRRTGLLAASLSAGIALGIEMEAHLTLAVTYWNALARLGMFVFFVFIISELRALYERERHSSRVDALTRIPNRRAFLEALDTEKVRARRYGLPLTLAYIDLDHFKEVNDRLGHAAGDELLMAIARGMQENLRRADLVGRLGGDEFAALLPETAAEAATAVLDKLQAVLNNTMQDRRLPVTFSMGAVAFHPPPDSTEEMLQRADEAMYAAKAGGRDRLIVRRLAA
ncbi:MAG TPA: diguanylate cyclase [Terriglobales bacterium]|nr:diguanylate cyclase [Terriglobales bacterium]